MISKKTYNLAGAAVTLFVPFVYFFGVYEWKVNQFSEMPSAVDYAKHIYFVSFSSAFYMLSFALFMALNNSFWKIVSSTVSSFCAVVLYQEIVYRDDQWTTWSYWLIAVVAANYLIFYCLIEKIKSLIRDGIKAADHN